jgi:hypothetical protein
MTKSYLLGGVLVAAVSLSFALADTASAAQNGNKRVPLSKAWSLCKVELDKRFGRDQDAQRVAAGTACLQKFGYQI